MMNGGRAAFVHLLLKRNLKGEDIRNVPRTDMLAEQQALTRKGVDALIEWILTEQTIPCAHLSRRNVSITSDGDPKADTLYAWACRLFGDLRYQTPTSLTRALNKEWGCTPWKSGNQRGVAFPDPAKLRAKFIARHGTVELPTDVKAWE
jgi:hypothetical protein